LQYQFEPVACLGGFLWATGNVTVRQHPAFAVEAMSM
jgi:hypothetical protein